MGEQPCYEGGTDDVTNLELRCKNCHSNAHRTLGGLKSG
jgi:HNH endonuclease